MKTKQLLIALLLVAAVSCKKKDATPASTPTPSPTPTPTTTVNPRIGFEKTIGPADYSEGGRYVTQTADGGYIVVGDSLRKTDANGVVVFTKPIKANSIMPTTDGNYILAGDNICKVSPNGDILWSQTMTVRLNFIHQTSDGGFIACGGYTVIKTDASGNTTWSITVGINSISGDNFSGNEIRQTTDGGYVLVGTQILRATSFDAQFMIYKLNATGSVLWVKEYGSTSGTDDGSSIKATADGGCIAAGMTSSGWFDMYLIKLNASGVTSWTQSYGDPDFSESAAHVQLTSDGGYILVGLTDLDGNGNTSNVYVVKTNSSGVKTWAENFGGQDSDYATCVQQTSDGGYIITGKGDWSSSALSKMYLLKLKY